ncbi:hypothetical protein Hanom_Chr04g00328761 [Helianthus anomalus]
MSNTFNNVVAAKECEFECQCYAIQQVFDKARDEGGLVNIQQIARKHCRSLKFPTGFENVYTKIFYKTEGSKTYMRKNFYTKTTYSPLTSEKFGGRPPPQSYALASKALRSLYIGSRGLTTSGPKGLVKLSRMNSIDHH